MSTEASQFSSLSPVSKWIGFSQLRDCVQKMEHYKCARAKLQVLSRPGIKNSRWPVQLHSIDQSRSRAIVLGLIFCTWINITNMSLHITIHGNF